MIMTKPAGVEALTPAYLTLRVEVADPGEQLRIAKGHRQEMESHNASRARKVPDKSRSGNPTAHQPDLSLADARVQVWKQHSEFRPKSRDAVVSSVEKTVTISGRVQATVDEAAERTAWQPLMEDWGRDTSHQEIMAKVRVELWRTPEGRALRELDRAAGSQPYSPKAVAEIRKSKDGGRFGEALELLEHGFPSR